MKIRPFKIEDYTAIVNLLEENNMATPTRSSDLRGICLVAEEREEIIGVIYALTGSSTQAYINYFAVKKDYREQEIGKALSSQMDKVLKVLGIERYVFYVQKQSKEMIMWCNSEIRQKKRLTKLPDYYWFRRDIWEK